MIVLTTPLHTDESDPDPTLTLTIAADPTAAPDPEEVDGDWDPPRPPRDLSEADRRLLEEASPNHLMLDLLRRIGPAVPVTDDPTAAPDPEETEAALQARLLRMAAAVTLGDADAAMALHRMGVDLPRLCALIQQHLARGL